MKIFLALLLIGSATQIHGYSDFVSYLLELQYAIEPYHLSMMTTFREARAELSSELTQLNSISVNQITEGLKAVIHIRDETETAVEGAEGSQVCIDNALLKWQQDLETVGAEIAQCADTHIDPILNATSEVHLFMQEQNRDVFDAQNLVLNVFTEINPLTGSDEITNTAMEQITVIYEKFTTETIPALETLLLNVSNLRQTVPVTIHSCVDVAVSKFNDEAAIIRNTVELC